MRTKLYAFIICMILSLVVISNNFIISAKEPELTVCSVLIEANSKVIISSKNENIPVPIGVMSKLMTIHLVAEEIE
ncbi:MAG: hypothetical protein J6A05_07585, partial [Oscillospiraceae bacterium]|nr:hypothetical protein [Oscillospiraceae bacterium]